MTLAIDAPEFRLRKSARLRDGSSRIQEARANYVHLDAIRGSAALVVVAGHERGLMFTNLTGEVHQGELTAPTETGGMDAGITIGHEAVMVFFVLSGYLVGGSVLKRIQAHRWHWKDYILRRLARLWIVLLPALALGYGLDVAGAHIFAGTASIYSSPAGQPYVPSADIGSLYEPIVVLGNVLFLQTLWFPTVGTNQALWSLSLEFWFYLAFPLFALGLHPTRPLRTRAAYLLVGALMLAVAGRHISFLFLIWTLGALISATPMRLPKSLAVPGSGFLALIVLGLFVAAKQYLRDVYLCEATVAAAFCSLLYLLHHQAAIRAAVYARTAHFFSSFSYTLYLVHLPILVFISASVNNPWRLLPKTPLNLAMFACVFCLTVSLAYLFYCLFEAHTDRVRRFNAQRV